MEFLQQDIKHSFAFYVAIYMEFEPIFLIQVSTIVLLCGYISYFLNHRWQKKLRRIPVRTVAWEEKRQELLYVSKGICYVSLYIEEEKYF